MEMEGELFGKHLLKWRRAIWATAYGNGRGLFG
jgi:hypothetical protein